MTYFLAGLARFFISVCLLALLSACNDSAIIWATEVKSPDGHLIASAHTEQFGGLGTAAVFTSVFLKQSSSSKKPVEVLTLSNSSAYPVGITSVIMSWQSPSQLQVAYKGDATIEFQAIKCLGVEVSVHHES